MAEINLVPGTQYIAAARKRRRTLFLLSTVIVLILVAITAVLFVLQQRVSQQLQKATTDLTAVETEIARVNVDAERVELFEKRLAVVGKLLDQHVSWNKMFSDLEKLLPPTTMISSLRADTVEGVIDIAGVTPNIDAVAQTFASLVASPKHESSFQSGQISNVTEKVVNESPEGAASRSYSFSGKLILGASSL